MTLWCFLLYFLSPCTCYLVNLSGSVAFGMYVHMYGISDNIWRQHARRVHGFSSDHIRRHCPRHHVGSGNGQSRSRIPKQSWALTAVFPRSVRCFTIFTFNSQVTCCEDFWLVQVGVFLRISPFCRTSHDFSHAADLGPRPAEDRSPSKRRRRRQGEGVRRGGGRGAPRGRGGRRQGGLEGDEAHTDGGSVAVGPKGPRGVCWF